MDIKAVIIFSEPYCSFIFFRMLAWAKVSWSTVSSLSDEGLMERVPPSAMDLNCAISMFFPASQSFMWESMISETKGLVSSPL